MDSHRTICVGSFRTMTWQSFVGRFLASVPYVLVSGGTALAGLFGLYALVLVFALSLLGPGLLLLPASLMRLRRSADAHRHRAAAVLGTGIRSDYRTPKGGVLVRAHTLLTDRATYADLLWLPLHALFGLFSCALTLGLCVGAVSWMTTPLWWSLVPRAEFLAWEINSWADSLGAVLVGLAYAALAGFLVPALARSHARMTRLLLKARRRKVTLARRIEELTASRAEALDAHAAELRRIERDLHDGAQAGLVSISLRLGLIKQAVAQRPEQLPEMIDRTHELAEQALTQLRQAVRAIYPPILIDRGLAEAVRSLVAACQVPTELDVDMAAADGRAAVAVESAAYFVISEALTNVAKHSGATQAQVRLHATGTSILISVWDNGRGGASEDAGSGLRGIRRRVAAFDGTTELTSPDKGPTTLRVELPCGS
ncbi:sensor histidine kinase [Streptomyces sp. NPDC021212]|uniref:sensor histidine kinase n=1 Tax=Streptomyces sp. NPDC021212 TaxID=3365118 RepID=UPI003799708B